MNRRTYLLAAGGTVGAVAGGTAVASVTRADLLADSELTRGEGAAFETERTVTRDSVEYVESSGVVEEDGQTEPFDEWARRECDEVAANTVVGAVEDRIDGPVDGVGSGVRYLLFGPVVTVDHNVLRDRDGAILSEPNVELDRLIDVAPRTLTATVVLDGRRYTRSLPVGVGHSEVQQL